MLGQDNAVVKQQLIKQIPQLQNKQDLIQYYVSYDFPDKQKNLKNWWQQLINIIIRKKRQIYVTFKDLQFLVSMHNLRPLPMKPVLTELKDNQQLIKQEQMKRQKPKRVQNSWAYNIKSLLWKSAQKNIDLNPFKFERDEKIISLKIKDQKRDQLRQMLCKQFSVESTKINGKLVDFLSWQLRIDRYSVGLLLEEMQKDKQLVIVQATQNHQKLIIFSQDKIKMLDYSFVKIQSTKFQLAGSIQKLDANVAKHDKRIKNLTARAKQYLQNGNKIDARKCLMDVKRQQQYKKNIQNRSLLLSQKLHEIQMKQIDKASINIMQRANDAQRQIQIDLEKLDQLMQKNVQNKAKMDQINQNFVRMGYDPQFNQQIDDQLDKMVNQIKQSKKKLIQPKSVNVQIQYDNNRMSQEKQLQIDI